MSVFADTFALIAWLIASALAPPPFPPISRQVTDSALPRPVDHLLPHAANLLPSDFPSLIKKRNAKQALMFRDSWGADYDHPQDWFDNLWTCSAAQTGHGGQEGYCNPAMDKTLATANAESIDKAVPLYQQAGQTLIDDNVDAVLAYNTQTYFTHTYVKGAGFNSLYDYNWQGIRILQH